MTCKSGGITASATVTLGSYPKRQSARHFAMAEGWIQEHVMFWHHKRFHFISKTYYKSTRALDQMMESERPKFD